MSEIKVGDRVKIYECIYVPKIFQDESHAKKIIKELTGVILEIDGDALKVEFTLNEEVGTYIKWFHRKQCELANEEL